MKAEAGAPGAPAEPGGRPAGRANRRRRVVAVILAGVVLAGAACLGSPAIGDWLRQIGAGVAGPSPSTAPPATAAATPAHVATPTPVPTATPAATATLRVHVVVRGETLTSIAARYGVTVAAIQKANGIRDPSLIYVGQRLVIPRR